MQDEVNQEDSEQNEVDGMKKEADSKSFHIEARQSSARQCWLVLAYVASQYFTSYDSPMD